jgi:hypothetical protein
LPLMQREITASNIGARREIRKAAVEAERTRSEHGVLRSRTPVVQRVYLVDTTV